MTEKDEGTVAGQESDPTTWDDAFAETIAEGATDEASEDEAEPIVAEKPEGEAPEQEAEGEPIAEVLEALHPLPSWSTERRALFDKIAKLGEEGVDITPRDVQQFVVDFYKEEQSRASSAVQERAEAQQRLEQFEKPLEKLEAQWSMQGIGREQGLSRLVQFEQWVYNDPKSALMWLADQAGVNLGQLHENRPYVDPQVQRLEAEMNRMREMQSQERRDAEKAQTQSVVEQIKSFETETDEGGQLKHPYFSEVLPVMIQLAQAGQAKGDVEQTYQIACLATPGVKDRYMDDQNRAQLQAATQTETPAAPTVDKGGSRITGKRSQTAVSKGKEPTNWDDAILESASEAANPGY